MSKIKKFPKEFLQDILYNNPSEIVERQLVRHTEWSVVYNMVFKHGKKFYQTEYHVGATEMQDEAPFQHSPKKVECIEVEPHEFTQIRWLPKE